jgi:hypothetical protein
MPREAYRVKVSSEGTLIIPESLKQQIRHQRKKR